MVENGSRILKRIYRNKHGIAHFGTIGLSVARKAHLGSIGHPAAWNIASIPMHMHVHDV